MKPTKLVDLSQTILLLIGEVFLFAVCVYFIHQLYNSKIAPEKRVAEEFTNTTCVVVAKSLSVVGRMVPRYRADFRLEYNTFSRGTVTSTTSANGLDFSYSPYQDQQQQYIDEYDVNGNYPCWYDPQDPSVVVLVLMHNWMSTLPLLLPSVVAIFLLFYMFKSVVQILESYVALNKYKNKY
jgi:hypothetical protein